MKVSILVLALFATLSTGTAAFAANNDNNGNNGNNGSNGNNGNNGSNGNGGNGGNGGNSTATVGNVSTGASTATTGAITNTNSNQAVIEEGALQSSNDATTNVNIEAVRTYRPVVNSAFAPTIFPTAPCMGSSSVGATGSLFSFSGGTSWTSQECMILETARSFDQAGFTQDGLVVRCQGKWAKNAPSCKALIETK